MCDGDAEVQLSKNGWFLQGMQVGVGGGVENDSASEMLHWVYGEHKLDLFFLYVSILFLFLLEERGTGLRGEHGMTGKWVWLAYMI